VAAFAALAACAPAPSGPVAPSGPAGAGAAGVSPAGPFVEQGLASWYGPGFAGRRTANGEVFDPSVLTAAHKQLPFNTLVRVHNLDNGRSVVVRINDRGPFISGRVIDLSRAGAEAIGMIRSGTARVRLELLTMPEGTARIGAAGSLLGFEVMSRLHPVGTLLVIQSLSGGERFVVRVISQQLPADSPADILVGLELYALVGSEARVQAD